MTRRRKSGRYAPAAATAAVAIALLTFTAFADDAGQPAATGGTAGDPTAGMVGAPNDICANAFQISGTGIFMFDNVGADTDGLADPLCSEFGNDQIANDVWYCWTSTCEGFVTLSMCGLPNTVDTKVAVYAGCSCPTGAGILACDDDGCGVTGGPSALSWFATGGQTYLIRIGNFPGATQGTGMFAISGVVCNVLCDAGGPYTAGCAGTTTDITLDATGSLNLENDDPLQFLWDTDCPGGTFNDDTAADPTLTVDTTPGCQVDCMVFLNVNNGAHDADCQAPVTITDTTPPGIQCPGEIVVECFDLVPPPDPASVTCTDACTPVADLTVTHESDTPLVNPCGGKIIRTYRCTDACGNFSECEQVITVNDTIPPVAPPAPIGLVLSCAADVPPPAPLTAVDNCDGDIEVLPTDDVMAGTCLNDFTLLRTWTFTDACDNSTPISQTIIVSDTVAPVPPAPPANQVLQCGSAIPPGPPLTAVDNCDGDITVFPTDDVTPGGCPNQFTLVRTWTFADICGNTVPISQTFDVNDTVAPVLTCPAETDIVIECGDEIPAVPNVTAFDNCDGVVPVLPASSIMMTGCGGEFTITRSWEATDSCGNSAGCMQVINAIDTTPPLLVCPPDLTVLCGDPTDPSATGVPVAADACDPSPMVGFNDVVIPTQFPQKFTIIRTWTATDGCGFSSSCDQTIFVTCPSENRVSATEKGSLLIFSKVEIRWDQAGAVIQDTFVDLTNDWSGAGNPVLVNMYFVNGDGPLDAAPGERAHPGWNWVDVKRPWTADQPAYWSALTGQPGPGGGAVAPFTILDPSADPTMQGRPATDGSSDRVLRGFIVAFAVDEDCCPISWNHLKGDATLVNYRDATAWEYNAWSFQDGADSPPGTPLDGCVPGDTAKLTLDGLPGGYVMPYSHLLLDFYAPGTDSFSHAGGLIPVVSDTSLTLHPVDADLHQEGRGPISTKASFVVWNEDETQFTNMHRCITCWDQTLLSLYTEGGAQNHFVSLQTDKGKARIDGVASVLCSSTCCLDRGAAAGCNDADCQSLICDVDPFCCNTQWDLLCAEQAVALCEVCDSLQVPAPLLGVAARHLSFTNNGGLTFDASGLNLVGMGTEPACIGYDPADGNSPPAQTMPVEDDVVREVFDLIGR